MPVIKSQAVKDSGTPVSGRSVSTTEPLTAAERKAVAHHAGLLLAWFPNDGAEGETVHVVADAIPRLLAENDAHRRRVTELESALRPFADPDYPGIAIGDGERARVALAKENPGV